MPAQTPTDACVLGARSPQPASDQLPANFVRAGPYSRRVRRRSIMVTGCCSEHAGLGVLQLTSCFSQAPGPVHVRFTQRLRPWTTQSNPEHPPPSRHTLALGYYHRTPGLMPSRARELHLGPKSTNRSVLAAGAFLLPTAYSRAKDVTAIRSQHAPPLLLD